ARLAARKDQSEVHARDFSEALEKITLGPERHILLNPADRERTAYHESGHALLGLLVPGSDPVHRVTIVPRGMALGATYQLPTDDRTNYPDDYPRARIISALPRRAPPAAYRLRDRPRDREGRGRGGPADQHRVEGTAQRCRFRKVCFDPPEEPERHDRDDHRRHQCHGGARERPTRIRLLEAEF